MIDIDTVRSQFPSLAQMPNGERAIFFDNPAGTQVPQQCMDALVQYFTQSNANVGGSFATSEATGCLIDDARAAMADFLNAASPQEIAFGQNMTSLTYEVSHALARILEPGDEIVTTRLEHDANVAPWLALEERGAVVRWIDIDPETMTLDMESAERAITDRTRLVCVGYASNAVGTINDVARIAQMAHAHNAWVYVDAVHYGPHGPIDVQALDVDLLVCSSYKFFGPHLGILYGRQEVMDALPAYHVRPAGNVSPEKWETGTKNHECLAALMGTIQYLCTLAPDSGGSRREQLHAVMSTTRAYERALSERLIQGMQRISGLTIFGITDPAMFDRRAPTVSWLVEGQDPYRAAKILGEHNVFSWAGNHYAVEPLERLGLEATQRIGLVHYNTEDEIDRFLELLDSIGPRARV